MDGGIGLDGMKRWGDDGAGIGDASQVVATHVDDHRVFGAVLFALGQIVGQRAVGGRVRVTWAGPLHGLGGHASSHPAKKQFR